MSRNIIINGIVYPNVPSVVLVDELGNDIQYDFTDELTFFGEDTELLRTVWSDERLLSSYSGWANWTPSSSSSSYRFSDITTVGTETLDLSAYDYMVEMAYKVSVAYNSGTTLTNRPQIQFGRYYYMIIGTPSIVGQTAQQANVVTLNDTAAAMVYYDNQGVAGNIGWGATTGFVSDLVTGDEEQGYTYATPTINSSGVLTMKTPAFVCRTGTNFAISVKSTVAAAETTISRKVNLYRMKAKKSIDSKIYQRSLDLIENDL